MEQKMKIGLERFSGIADEGSASISRQLEIHKQLGWSSIELRTVEGRNICEMDDRDFEQVAAAVIDTGFSVSAFGSAIANWSRPVTGDFSIDRHDLLRAVPRMKTLNTDYIRVMSYTSGGLPEREWAEEALKRLKELVRIAEGEGVVLVHENCDGWASQTPANLKRMLGEIDSKALQIVFDPGNPLNHGSEPEEVWDFYHAAKPRIVHFHIKDCYVNEEGKPEHCFPGQGQCEIRPIVEDLEASGYRGMYAIEPHMTVQIHKSMEGDAEAMEKNYIQYGTTAVKLLS